MSWGSIFYFLFWAGVIAFMMRFGCGAHVMGHRHGHNGRPEDKPASPPDGTPRWAPADKTVDPVCRKNVETATAKSAVYAGEAYYFCSQDCRSKFEANPSAYVNTAGNNSTTKDEHHHGC